MIKNKAIGLGLGANTSNDYSNREETSTASAISPLHI
jgi:hypothetical protein